MQKRLNCSQGHQWELTVADHFSAVLQAIVCPFCGSGAETAVSQDSDLSAKVPTDPEATPAAPTHVGARYPAVPGYEIEGLLGKGGMGIVYKARQVRLKRTVALKMIKAGDGADLDDLLRFRAEAEAVARFQHPNIVQVFEVGEHGRQPYFSLEYVDGGSLAQKLAGTPQPPRPAAALVLALARAMHAAHEAGVVHRDLKPANVLLTQEGTPKVTDFGLAKKLDEETGQTRTGAIMGTPSYMAPEQASGRTKEIGPLTDVYALGAILYEMLTGRPPFKGASVLETTEQVRSVEPVPPSRLQPKVPRDLETICLKCLQKDPVRRYGSAAELADDLGRFLNGESIRARPVGRVARSWRWCRRNPVVAGLLATVAGVLLVGASVASVLAVVASDQAAQARRKAEEEKEAREKAVTAQQKAEEARERTWQALEDMTSQAAADWLGTQKELRPEQERFLNRVVGYYQEFAQEVAEDEAGRRRVAASNQQLGVLLDRLGKRVEAEAAYGQAVLIREKLVADFPDRPEYRLELAGSYNNRALMLKELAKRNEAETAYRRALDLLGKLATEFPNVPRYQQDLAKSQSNLGVLLLELGKREDAEDAYRQALAIRTKLADVYRNEPAYRKDLADSHNNLGMLLTELKKPKQAEESYRQALAVFNKLVAEFRDVPEYRNGQAVSQQNLGVLLRERNRLEEAEESYRKALDIYDTLVTDFPNLPEYRQNLGTACTNLGLLLQARGKLADAEEIHRKGLAIREKLVNDFPRVSTYKVNLAVSLSNLGRLAQGQGKREDALGWYDKAITTLTPVLQKEPALAQGRFYLRNAHWGRALTLDQLGRREDALRDWDRALELDDSKSSELQFRRAGSLILAGEHARAVAAAEELAKTPGIPAATIFQCAALYGLSARVVQSDAALKEKYEARAVHLLQQARAGGFFKSKAELDQLRKNPGFQTLRNRADFQQLLQELEQP